MAIKTISFKTFEWMPIEFDEIETIEAVKEGDPRIYLTPEGNFPSMTTILGQLTKKSDIDAWRDYVGHDEADKIVAAAIDRGNALHDYNERYLNNELQRSDMNHAQAKMLFNRVKQYLDAIELVIGTESPLYSKSCGYAGRCDAIGVVDGDICIIDHKNTRKVMHASKYGRKKLWKYKIQCCGYARALYEMTGVQASHGYLVVGNVEANTGEAIKFELTEELYHDLDVLVEAWYHNGTKKEKAALLKTCNYHSVR